MYALQWEMRIDMGKTCKYFLNFFPSQLMSGDARKPNIKSQNPRTQYTEFWIKNMLFYYENWRIFHFFIFPLEKMSYLHYFTTFIKFPMKFSIFWYQMCLHNKKINFDKNIQKLEKLEKSLDFTVTIAVFQNSVYWVQGVGD